MTKDIKVIQEFVKKECGGFRLKDLKTGKWSDFWQESIWMPSDEPKNFDKVIGNIHEHPHLLDNPTL